MTGADGGKTVILANGEYPNGGSPAGALLASARRVVACDGAADAYRERTGREPDFTVGDLDSQSRPLDAASRRVIRIPDQDTNDLEKAIAFCRERGWTDLVIVGATGKREDHALSNVFRAMAAGVEIVTDTGRFVPFCGKLSLKAAKGAPLSVFATDPATHMTSKGLEWPLDGVTFANLYCATLNRTTSDQVEIVADHPAFAFVPQIQVVNIAMNIEELEEKYADYVDTFRGNDGSLPEMMELKRVHTRHVLANARLIADGENFSPDERAAAEAAALLHDTGRYEQLKRYNTFRDSESVDHAVFSHDIVRDLGWLDGRPDRDAILKAVLCHNRRDLPPEIEDPLSTATSSLHLASVAAHAVRDADKLDIFRVLETLVSKPDWKEDRTAFWNLDVLGAPNPEVVRAVEERRPVDYQNIRTLADFVLIQVGWMISGLHFATSRSLSVARGHLDFRRRFLHELTDDPAVDRLCDLCLKPREVRP